MIEKKKSLRVLLMLLLLLGFVQLNAQQLQPLPIDPKLRYGKLDNGMTYYIRHNEQPKQRADFYIAQKVGSVLEEENQRGLAHFLEHMAFDGSKNFPKDRMDQWTESIGMRGGENFNAYTSFDETVYMLMNAPVTRAGIIDSCLLILHDWSSFISLTDSAIEKERGVIREEWRTGQDAQMRLWQQQLPKMYAGSRYANRMPIGSIDVINNFKHDELRAYYKKWYRPDQQGLIIVGDVNVDSVEQAIKRIFADIPAPVNPAKRIYFDVPDNDKPIVSIAKDKEAQDFTLYIFYKHDKLPLEQRATAAGLINGYMEQVCASMMNDRFDEILHQANPPFVDAQATDGDFMIAKTKAAWTVAALTREGQVDSTLMRLVMETQRLRQFGFTASEYERARVNILKSYENIYNDRDKQKNRTFTQEYVNHFTDGGYIPGIETEYALINSIAPQIGVKQVNEYIQQVIGEKNVVIGLTGPDKADLKYPTEEELLSTFNSANAIPVKAYEEKVSNEPLIPHLPAPGKIVSTKRDGMYGSTILTLGNGVKVVIKPTNFKKDEVLMTATSPGGNTLYGKEDIANLKVFNDVISLGGLGNFSDIDLNKRLAGKQVSCSVGLASDNESVSGSAVPADLKTLFELIYLNFTAPRMDQAAFDSYVTRSKAQLQNAELDPMVAFSDTLTEAVYQNNPRAVRTKMADLDKISYPRIMQMFKERFGDASDFVFTFVGNVNIDSIRPFVQQYLATLPAKGRVEKGDEANQPSFRTGQYVNDFHRTMETPKATVIDVISGKMDRTLENVITMNVVKQVLDLVYMEKVREAEGGTYGVSTSVSISSFPKGRTLMQIYFDTDPAKRVRMNEIVHNELKSIAENGPRDVDFQKTVDNLLKRHAEMLQENSYWLNALDNYYFRGFDSVTAYEATVKNMTKDKVKAALSSLLSQGNNIEVVMEP